MAIINELQNLGDAVRERAGIEDLLTINQMADVVANIPQPDLTPYAKKEEVEETLKDYTTITQVNEKLTDYATIAYVDEAVSDSGGSVAIDGKTIIQNADGTISTAIGGAKVETTPKETVYLYEDAIGITNLQGYSRVDFSDYIQNYLNTSKTYYINIEWRNSNTGETGSSSGYATNISGYDWNVYNLYLNTFPITKLSAFYENDNWFSSFFVGGMFGFFDYWGVDYITKCECYLAPVYEYETIDANFISIGNGLEVNEENQLIAPLEAALHTENNCIYQDSTDFTKNTNHLYPHSACFGYFNTFKQGQGMFCAGTMNNLNEGVNTIALGESNSMTSGTANNVMIGYNNISTKNYSYAIGCRLDANSEYQMVLGKYNIADSASAYNFIIGNGTSNATANGLTIDASGNVVVQGTISNAGADYAEYFEWADGNPNGEDRVGLLVALDGNKIKLADTDDDILGIISGTATVLGDDAEWVWQGRYLRDDFGRLILEEVEMTHEEKFVNEEGEIETKIVSGGTVIAPKINPEYDDTKEYISRAKRKEWDAVGMMGKLFLIDDGTCEVNGYATPYLNGIATKAITKTNMRVMERINNNIIRVCMK